MKSDRLILVILPVVALLAAYWFLLLSPKRDEVAQLDTQITELEQSVADQEELAAFGQQARKTFPSSYRKIINLGKAVPGDSDTASFLVQLQSLALDTDVDFRTINLTPSTSAPAPPPPPPPPAEGEEGEEGDEDSGEETPEEPTTPAVAPATEATAASLPIGASIGPAGLPVMQYEMTFSGDFFEIADFLKGVDALVKPSRKNVEVDGRLVTVNGFTLERDEVRGFPKLSATFSVTTYVSPEDEGVTAGASPTGPSAAAPIPTSTDAGVTP